MKKALSLLLTLVMVIALVGCQPAATDETEATPEPEVAATPVPDAEPALYTAGTYTASAMGNNGDVTVEVTFTDDAISAVSVVSHTETAGISDPAIAQLPEAIVSNQSLGVDTVTGATNTSKAILKAVEDCVTQAGGDAEALKGVTVAPVEADADEEYTADVVVLGAGGAGMAAAVTANQSGKTVVVIEASAAMGGNTIMAGGALNGSNDEYVPLTQMSDSYTNTVVKALTATPVNDEHAALIAAVQAEYDAYLASGSAALFDSVNWHVLQTWSGGDFVGDLDLVRTLCENIWDGIDWLKEMGMTFLDGEFTVTGGLWPRAHKPTAPVGTGFFITYGNYVDTHEGITMVYNTTAKSLIVEGGKVVGAVCEGASGNTVTARANNGVVLATGGFGRNIALREQYNAVKNQWPSLGEGILSTNAATINGDGIEMATAIGAALTGMEHIQLLPLGDPVTGALAGNIEHDVETRVFINKEGNRFENEGGRRDDMTLGLFDQTDNYMWIVMDSDTYPTGDETNNFGETANQLVEAGRAIKADSIEDLASQMGVATENLIVALDEFNRHCIGGDMEGTADEFGRTLFSTPIDTPPYYAAARVPTVHHTMGGVVIDAECRVQDEAGNAIAGLYAAGEVTGGIHGANRLGGNALADTVVFGRIAGTSASEMK